MAQVEFAADERLLVASRGAGPEHGLWAWRSDAGQWRGEQIGRVEQLSSLAGHPHLPVVYGTSGTGQDGWLHGWRIDAAGAAALGPISSGGAEPCHLAVHPGGRLLVAVNYTTSTLALQPLAEDGGFAGPLTLYPLTDGAGPEIDRQDTAHPHQALFMDGRLLVIDLGADLLRIFDVDADGPGLTPVAAHALPAGSGPRHGAILADGRLAISGELDGRIFLGRDGAWAAAPGSQRSGPGRARWDRNYPGDIRASADGRHVHFANRSHCTIATFDITGPDPVMTSEVDAGCLWPQHLLVRPDHLLIAGWDSGQVMALPVADGQPGPAEPLFNCAGAGWLHLHRIPA